jgi:hypothetical protein
LHVNSYLFAKDTSILGSTFPSATMAQEVVIANDAMTSFSFATDGMSVSVSEKFTFDDSPKFFFRYNPKAAAHEGFANDLPMSSFFDEDLDGDSVFSDE